jgi:hypothetical protein
MVRRGYKTGDGESISKYDVEKDPFCVNAGTNFSFNNPFDKDQTMKNLHSQLKSDKMRVSKGFLPLTNIQMIISCLVIVKLRLDQKTLGKGLMSNALVSVLEGALPMINLVLAQWRGVFNNREKIFPMRSFKLKNLSQNKLDSYGCYDCRCILGCLFFVYLGNEDNFYDDDDDDEQKKDYDFDEIFDSKQNIVKDGSKYVYTGYKSNPVSFYKKKKTKEK